MDTQGHNTTKTVDEGVGKLISLHRDCESPPNLVLQIELDTRWVGVLVYMSDVDHWQRALFR